MTVKETVKLQKFLADAGLGSRRQMEEWIQAGRVSVNKTVATLGDRVALDDFVTVDGRVVKSVQEIESKVLIYNKPVGEICTRNDPEGRSTVFDKLPSLKKGRWISVGRLDINTSGLLLFTTDGELANRLMHPRSLIDREYAVRLNGEVEDDMLARLRAGVMLDDGEAKFTDIQRGRGTGQNIWYYVVVMEGRNREVRRLWESQGLQVSRLKRVRFGPVFLPSDVPVGVWKMLEGPELNTLFDRVDYRPNQSSRKNLSEQERLQRLRRKQWRQRGPRRH